MLPLRYERQIIVADAVMDDGWTLIDCPYGTCANKTNYHQASFYATQYLRHNQHAERHALRSGLTNDALN